MLLITAFEPFDGSGLNASQEALRLFSERFPYEIGGVALASATLPVRYGDDVLALDEACARLPEKPSAILHLGQTREGQIAIETRAVNVKKVGGELLPIEASAPKYLDATYDAAAIVLALGRVAIRSHTSQDAGTFLCNHILFRSLQREQNANSPRPIGFVHLPRLHEQLQPHEQEAAEPPHLPLQVLARAIEIAALTVAESLQDNSAPNT
jgi:pyroglutamyl-peptidase